jgi:hypothetical protein
MKHLGNIIKHHLVEVFVSIVQLFEGKIPSGYKSYKRWCEES